MFEKIWDDHVVTVEPGGQPILYIDLQLMHEVTSPQAFEGLRLADRKVRRPERTVATADHNVPTTSHTDPIEDPIAKTQIETLEKNCAEFDITYYGMGDIRQGVIHVMGPEQGYTQPGMTIVCGDSHTATHGAFGALAFGIGTSEIEHVLATQTLRPLKPKTFEIRIDGELPEGSSAKDLILYVIGQITTEGGTGYCVEYTGEAIKAMSMESRMTVCNMTIEAGARAGLIAPDEVTYEYLKGRPAVPGDFDSAIECWSALPTDEGAEFDRVEVYKAADIEPQVTWGTNPGQVCGISECVPDPADIDDPVQRKAAEAALEYVGLEADTPMVNVTVDWVFIGSCTNGRIEDLRAAAKVAKGHKVADTVRAIVVPGSGLVKKQAEEEGLDKIFIEAGFEWREPGCSMCLAMNPDKLESGERSASTSNRNFEGRQGAGSRTHLVSPATAAATAIAGHFVDVRNWDFG